ncbi:sulfotransferase 1B1-like [Glandiceps talaboti]
MAGQNKKDEDLKPDYGHLGDAFVACKGYYLPPYIEEDRMMDEELDNFIFTEDDVLVDGFPKSGTTWMTRILQAMYSDWALVKVLDREIVPILEWTISRFHTEGAMGMAKKKFLEEPTLSSSRRLLKSHLPYELLPSSAHSEDTCKIIHMTRNPKDSCTNFFHLERSLLPMTSPEEVVSWDDFVENFAQGRVVYGPWQDNIVEWWRHGPDEDVLHVTYEELQHNREAVVKMVADFLERPLSDADIKRVVKATEIDETVMNVAGRSFRRGKIGEWKEHFTKKQSELFDNTICAKLKYHGLAYVYESYQ